jgi:tRNA pseudouridine55 synthase
MNKEGLILVNKPAGLTSHDIVLRIRDILQLSKVGHFGTLDPIATGLLLIAVGKATRFFPFYSKMDKSYHGTIRLGWATSTYDTEGEPITEEVTSFPAQEKIEAALQSFSGRISQLPPLFSAKKFKGKPLYYLARNQKKVERQPIEVEIYRFQLIDYQPPFLEFKLDCSSGTYVRTLAHDPD